MSRRKRQSGLTLVELIVAFSIMLILSTIALPLAHVKIQREKERRLRDALSEMRKAIDRYKDLADAGQLGQVDPDTFGYPPSLEVMVEGVPVQMGMGGMGQGGGFGTPASQTGGKTPPLTPCLCSHNIAPGKEHTGGEFLLDAMHEYDAGTGRPATTILESLNVPVVFRGDRPAAATLDRRSGSSNKG